MTALARNYDEALEPFDPTATLRDQAIAEVDQRHGYSVEFAGSPNGHRQEWNERWAVLVAGDLIRQGRFDDLAVLTSNGWVDLDELRQGGRIDESTRSFVPGPLWASIGNIVVVRGWPPEGNPYRTPPGCQVTGEERIMALTAFRDGDMLGDTTFWYAPAGGGARHVTEPHEIDWKGMRS